jgi:fatty acid desaturase
MKRLTALTDPEYHPLATLVVLGLPLALARVVMMLGNWTQHAFIAPASPDNCYTNSITCINTPYNHACWNDGYHISHHLKPALHWTDHPTHFRHNLAQYVNNEAIVFEGIHFLHIFRYLMGRRYDLLARHFVELQDPLRTEGEVMPSCAAAPSAYHVRCWLLPSQGTRPMAPLVS